MNTYEFEYDTRCHWNKKIVYKSTTLAGALKKLKKNCRVWQILGLKENGVNLSKLVKKSAILSTVF